MSFPPNVLGIDPGIRGGIALISGDYVVQTWQMPESEAEIADLFRRRIAPAGVGFCLVEFVHAFPEQGVHSVFTFGRNDGLLVGQLLAYEIEFEEIEPRTWQRALGISPRIKPPDGRKPIVNYVAPETTTDWKKRLQRVAQELFPEVAVTLQTADALLLAECARRIRVGYRGRCAI